MHGASSWLAVIDGVATPSWAAAGDVESFFASPVEFYQCCSCERDV
jgi:hypothetical protein